MDSDQIGYYSRPSNQVDVETTSIKKAGDKMDEGIDLRDWFAGMAMQALINTADERFNTISGLSVMREAQTVGWRKAGSMLSNRTLSISEVLSVDSYEIADAMMRISKEELIKRSKVLTRPVNNEGNDKE